VSNATGSTGAARTALLVASVVLGAGVLCLWLWSERVRPEEREVPVVAAPAPVPEPPPAREVLAQPDAPAERGAASGDDLAPFSSAPRTVAGLPRGKGALRGRVESASEDPFPLEWELVLRPSNTLPARESAVSRVLSFHAGEREFEVPDLPLGGYDVSVRTPGYNGRVLPVLLEPGSESPFVNLLIVPTGFLEGTIVDSDGLPAEGIPVTLFAVPDGEERSATTGPDGVYRFAALPDGPYELLVGRSTSPLLSERRPLVFRAPSARQTEIALPVLATLSVRVVDSLERPIEGVRVRGSGTQGGVVDGVTDSDGRLMARYLPAGHWRIRLDHPTLGKEYERRFAVELVVGEVTEAPVRLGP